MPMRKVDLICGSAVVAALLPLAVFMFVYSPVRQSGPPWLGSVSLVGYSVWALAALVGIATSGSNAKRRGIYIALLLFAPVSFFLYVGTVV